MKIKQVFTSFILLIVLIASCKNDDNATDETAAELQTLSETAIQNDAEIQTYLQTHFYTIQNSQIVIDTISGDNSDETSLAELAMSEIISLSPSDLGLEEDNDSAVDHKLYYLIIENGAEDGVMVSVADSTYLSYEGSRVLGGDVFDSSTGPVWFDLLGNPLLGQGGVVKGFQKGLAKFKQAGDIIENENGTYSVEDQSTGLIIMPSGLAYFSGGTPGSTTEELYSPLIFKVNVVRTVNADHDRDGIPSILEDLGNDEDFFADDTDDDDFANFIDTDDDGDGTLTIDEDLEPDTDLTVDRDGDGDKTNDIGDGNPQNDDTDGDGIPNYLDADDTASRDDDND